MKSFMSCRYMDVHLYVFRLKIICGQRKNSTDYITGSLPLRASVSVSPSQGRISRRTGAEEHLSARLLVNVPPVWNNCSSTLTKDKSYHECAIQSRRRSVTFQQTGSLTCLLQTIHQQGIQVCQYFAHDSMYFSSLYQARRFCNLFLTSPKKD